mmetsp:Transcript_2942/g.7146  ORF Transcript_2942/g.7146 Transcript_2942/m.7146 type:complete len:238 (+) Transcript_2942:1587-2300(+)
MPLEGARAHGEEAPWDAASLLLGPGGRARLLRRPALRALPLLLLRERRCVPQGGGRVEVLGDCIRRAVRPLLDGLLEAVHLVGLGVPEQGIRAEGLEPPTHVAGNRHEPRVVGVAQTEARELHTRHRHRPLRLRLALAASIVAGLVPVLPEQLGVERGGVVGRVPVPGGCRDEGDQRGPGGGHVVQGHVVEGAEMGHAVREAARHLGVERTRDLLSRASLARVRDEHPLLRLSRGSA